MNSRTILIWGAVAALAAAAAQAQEDEQTSGPALSHQMKTAIMFYERGDDMQAMDRFMEVLTKGDPAERAQANEYLNLITHRMNSGTKDFKKPAPAAPAAEPATIAEPEDRTEAPARTRSAPPRAAVSEPDALDSAPAAPAPRARPAADPSSPSRPAPASARPEARSSGSLSQANKALMKKEIKAKLRYLVETSLRELKAYDDVRVVMIENGDPLAIGIPSSLLFSSGIAFNKGAAKLLDSLTRLVYGLGSTQVLILPEGAPVGDAKVLDMRRSMGVSAHLLSAGIAAPRVKVNLLSTQVDIPKSLQDFKGTLVLFVYSRPLDLVVESALDSESGPPITLGVYPQSIRPDRSEGAIIEFSVSDPPAGLVSWKFQLNQPAAGSVELSPLQEVVGGGPVFHQIYWNGRQNYFGSILPGGRYECVVTATDAKNRTRTLHRWVQLGAEAPAAAKEELAAAPAAPAAPAKPAAKAGAPSADLPQEPAVKVETLVKGDSAPVGSVQITPPPAKRPAAAKRRRPAKRAAAGSAKAKGKAKPAAKVEAEPAVPAQGAATIERAPAAAPEAAPASAGTASASAVGSPPAAAAQDGAFVLPFERGSHQMAKQGKNVLVQVASAVANQPEKSIDLLGFADESEADAKALAERRAQMVASQLINKYQVEPKRIQVRSSVSAGSGAPKVEVRLAGKE